MVIMRAGWSNVTVATLLGVDNVGLFFLSTHGYHIDTDAAARC